MLEVSNLFAGYGDLTILRDISFRVEAGKTLAVLGYNGVGKTTLLRCLIGQLRPQQGAIRLDGRSLSGLKSHEIARMGVAYIAQESALFPDLSVRDNLKVAFGRRPDFDNACEQALQHFPFLKDRFTQRTGTLSGGEQKMLLLARALLVKPRLILADEVTEGVQPKQITRMSEIIRSANTMQDLTLVIVEQHIDFALALADSYLVIKQGAIAAAGNADAADALVDIERQLAL